MAKTTISGKYQVVIPKSVRESLHLKEGQELNVFTIGEGLYLTPRKKWPDDFLGSEREFWSKIDVTKFIDEERDSWD